MMSKETPSMSDLDTLYDRNEGFASFFWVEPNFYGKNSVRPQIGRQGFPSPKRTV